MTAARSTRVESLLRPLSDLVCHDSVTRPPLLLVSLDGLRPEYLQTWHTLLPVLDKLSESRPGRRQEDGSAFVPAFFWIGSFYLVCFAGCLFVCLFVLSSLH